MLARLAWTLCGVSALLVAADVVVAAQSVSLASETAVAVHGFPFIHGAAVGSALMGALIVSRYPRHPIGWLLSAVGTSTAVSLLTEAYGYWVLEADGPGPRSLGSTSAWVSQVFGGQVVIALLALMFLRAPDGRFLSPRWRYAAVIPGLGVVLCLATILSVDPTTFELIGADEQFGTARVVALSAGFSLISVGILLGLASMLRRLRGSTGEERQQLRLIALAAALAVVGLLILLVAQQANGGQQTWISGVPLNAAFFLMPILFAVATLRYRLYDLDVIINRTVVVAAAAGFAAVGYTLLVVLAGQVAEGRTGGFWLSLLATVLVALAFQPLRRVVVRLADRVAYGDRAQPYEALAGFSRRLAEAPDPDDLLPAVAEAAARAVSARGARAALDVPGGTTVAATWGWWASDHAGPDHAGSGEQAPDREVPVRTEGRELGRLAVALPRGRTLRPSDVRLLEALADQTAVAFRNTSLAGALAQRVAELDRATRLLADSRRRLIAADDAARRTLEAAIAREVAPFLRSLPDEVGRARAAVAADEPVSLEPLVDGAHAALEALRDLTRGVFPTQLARSGLEPTLRSLVARSAARAELTVDGTAGGRYPPRVEAAVYFCCAEALGERGVREGDTDAVAVVLTGTDDALVLRVEGAHDRIDLQAVTDRVEAVGGAVVREDGALVLRIPVAAVDPGSALAGGAGGAIPHR